MIFLVICLYAFAWHILFNFYDFLIGRSLISSPILLFVAILLPLLLLLIIFFIPLLILDLRIVVPEQNNSDTPSIVSPDKYHDSNLFLRLICNKMDEEGQVC
jgi:hypothetical protein